MSESWNRETPDRRERVYVTRSGDAEHRERIVTNTAAERTNAVYTTIQLIWLFFGILQGLIALRIVLRLIAANPASPFASLIYGITDLFLWPFFGLTGTPGFNGIVLEIPAIIAMLVYALLAWALVKIIRVLFYRPATTDVIETYDREPR